LVLHHSRQVQRGGVPFYFGANVTFPLPQVQRLRLRQPDMAINPGAFVEPTVAKAGVHAHHQVILAPIVQKIADVETERRVAVVVAANVISVEKDERIAKRSIEEQYRAAIAVCFGSLEDPAIPADAGFGILSAERLKAMALQALVPDER